MKRKLNNPKLPKLGKKFKKGKSGNPAGRPKGISITQYLKDLSEEEISMAIKDASGRVIKVENHTRAKALAMRMYDLAMKASERSASKYMELIHERVEGKVSQPIEVTHEVDLSKLTVEELKQLLKLQSKVDAGRSD